MYIDRCTTTVNGTSYTRILLRRSVRAGQKVTHPVVANLSDWPPQAIAALELALRHRRTLAALHALDSQLVQLRQGASIGAIWLLKELAGRKGITAALGTGRDGRLALWQVIARTLEHGSRLSAVRLAENPRRLRRAGDRAFHLSKAAATPWPSGATIATASAAHAKSLSACCATRPAGHCQWKSFAATRPT